LIDRMSFKNTADGATQWYEVSSTRVGEDLFHYVTDITQVIQAETVRREFVQTLTKTFANLTTGLAVFNRQQRLALFNPAFVDLTGLSAEFLSARPDLIGVFDNLRDRQIMPEPKNYANWRNRIGEIVATASDGLYQDTWSLPSGLTYRVTGRPHPDGAVAFLFEDISDEIALTRRFRTQLNLRQAVLDQLPDAIAVISPNKLLLLCNKRCSDLLGIDPDSSLAELSVADLIAICREHIPDDTFWALAESRLSTHSLTEPMDTVLFSRTGQPMRCRVSPLTGGSAMLTMAECKAAVLIDTPCQAAG
jgi:PAS domain-containing protein